MRTISEQRAGRAGMALGWSSRIVGLARVLGAIVFFALLHDPVQAGQSVILAWNATADPTVAGYKAYYGMASHTYTNVTDVGKATNVTISGLVAGASYYFAVTSYNTLGLESQYSSEVRYTVPAALVRLKIRAAPVGQFVVTVSGPAGHTYQVLATQDLKTWTVIGTVTVGAGGSSDFTDTDAASFPRRFYRTQ
jgi:hypothetical protein